MSYMCKRIFKSELQLSSYWQNIKFSWYCPKFYIFTKIVIFQVYLQLFLVPLLHPYKFYGRNMSEILFFHFCQLWAVNYPAINKSVNSSCRMWDWTLRDLIHLPRFAIKFKTHSTFKSKIHWLSCYSNFRSVTCTTTRQRRSLFSHWPRIFGVKMTASKCLIDIKQSCSTLYSLNTWGGNNLPKVD